MMNRGISVRKCATLSLIERALDAHGYAIKHASEIVLTQRGGYYMRLVEQATGKLMFAKVLHPSERILSRREIRAHARLPRLDAAMYSLDVVRIPNNEGEWIALVTTLLGEYDMFTWMTSEEYGARRELGSALVRSDVLQIAHDISTQLARLHGVGMIHGDVKVENVVVSSDSDATLDALFVLVDFDCGQQFCDVRADVGGTKCYADVFTLKETDIACACSSDTWQLGIIMAMVLLNEPLPDYRRDVSDSEGGQALKRISPEYVASCVIQCAYHDESTGFLPALEAACKDAGLPALFTLLHGMLSPLPRNRPSAEAVRAFLRSRLKMCTF